MAIWPHGAVHQNFELRPWIWMIFQSPPRVLVHNSSPSSKFGILVDGASFIYISIERIPRTAKYDLGIKNMYKPFCLYHNFEILEL